MAKRILFLTPQPPYPPEQGTALRNFNLMMQVARRHEVSLLSFSEDSGPDWGPLRDICQTLRAVPMPQRTMMGRLHTLLLTTAPDMARRLHSSSFTAALRDMVDHEGYDIVQVEGIELAPYGLMMRQWLGPRCPAIVFDDHNAEYVLQRRAFETDIRLPRRWAQALYSWLQSLRLRRFERQVIEAADGVLAVSPADAEALRGLGTSVQPLVLPNGVDIDRYHPDLPDSVPLQHPAVVYTAKMDFRPNVDAMLWFYERVWPAVRAARSDARLYVVGQSPHPRLDPLRNDPSVIVTGYVTDILGYFGGADLYIVPLRIGGGTRLKVLEAMSAGLPLVSTALGVEGIALTPGRHVLLADAPEDFGAQIIALLADSSLRRTLGQAARQFVCENYDWRSIVPKIEPLYAAL